MDWKNIDWSQLRPEIRYVAVDHLGPYGFSERPRYIIFWDDETWNGVDSYSLDCLAWTNLPSESDYSTAIQERPHEWKCADENTPIDTPVWYWIDGEWHRGHKASAGVWKNGGTSWTQDFWLHTLALLLPDLIDPNREPPQNWKP